MQQQTSGSITIETGVKRLTINNDPTKVIEFNPTDLGFVERFYELVGEFETKLAEYRTRAEEVESHGELDGNGIPTNTPERMGLMRETCEYVRSRIDHLFGAGTSQTAFGDAMVLDMFTQFFKGVTPYITSVRAAKVERYIQSPTKGRKTRRKAR